VVALSQEKGLMFCISLSPITSWNDTIQNPTIADVILDYLIYSAHKINLKGELMRKIRSSLTIDNNSEK
jgi:hypothetical protein